MGQEFFKFLKQYNVIGMSIAVIMGTKINEFVSTLVNDLLLPLLLNPVLKAAGVSRVRELSYNGILYGKVIGSAIDFSIIAFIIFVFCKMVLKEAEVAKK